MIRSVVFLFLAALAAAVVLSLAGESGRASILWLGWRADMTATALRVLVLLVSLLAFAAWRLVLWVVDAPRRAAAARAESRRRQELEVLTRGFVAVAAGDGAEARRLAAKAADLSAEAPALARLLTARAAEAAEDPDAEDVVPQGAGEGPARPGEPGGDRPAQGSPRTEAGRLEGQHLAIRLEKGLDLGQRRPGPGGENQLGGIVVDEAAVGCGVQGIARDGASLTRARPRSPDLQGAPLRRRRPHCASQDLCQVGFRSIRNGQRAGLLRQGGRGPPLLSSQTRARAWVPPEAFRPVGPAPWETAGPALRRVQRILAFKCRATA